MASGARFCGSCGAATEGAPAEDAYVPGFSQPPAGTPGVPAATAAPAPPPEPQVRAQATSITGDPVGAAAPVAPLPPTAPAAAPPSRPAATVPVPPAAGVAAPGAPPYVAGSGGYVLGQAPPAGTAGSVPGQTANVPGQSGGSGAKIVLAAAVILVVAVVAFAVVSLIGRGGSGGGQAASAGLGGGVPMGAAPSGEPEERWSESIECPSTDESYTGCTLAVSDDTVFVVEGDDERSTLQAYATSDGSSRWDASLASSGYVTIVGGTVIATATDYDSEESSDEIIAFDPKSGDERWSKSFESVSVNDGLQLSGSVVLTDYRSDPETVVLDLDDGSERWSENGQAVAQCGGSVILSSEGELKSVSAASGDADWSADLDKDSTPSSAGCVNGGVAVIDDQELVAFSSKDGDEMWSERLPEELSYLGPVKDGQVILFGGSHVAGYSAKDGSETWDERIKGADDQLAGDIYVTDDGILLAMGGEEAVLRDAKTGKEKASTRLGDAVLIELASNALLVGDGDEVTAYDTGSLDERWTVDAADVGAAFADGGSVYLLSAEDLTAVG